MKIHSKSFRADAPAVRWACDGGTEFEMSDGTELSAVQILFFYFGEDCKDFESEHVLRSTIEKYCSFMPLPIYFDVVKPAGEAVETDEIETLEEVAADEAGENAEQKHLKRQTTQ